jgi:hypothetical protein
MKGGFRAAVIDPANPEQVRLFQSLVWKAPAGSPHAGHYAVASTPQGIMTGRDAIPAVYDQLGLPVPSDLGAAPFVVADPAASAAVRKVIARDLLEKIQ